MSDYKRFVSYLYCYDNGIKKNNIGYARVETRNGQCKITIHIKLLSLSSTTLDTYLFYRKGNRILGLPLCPLPVKNSIGDCQTIFSLDKVLDSELPFSMIGGIIIAVSPSRLLGTEWDDLPIIPSVFEPEVPLIAADLEEETNPPEKAVNEPFPIETVNEPTSVKTTSEPASIKTISKPASMETASEPASVKTTSEPTSMKTVNEPAPVEMANKPVLMETANKPAPVKTISKPTSIKTTNEPIPVKTVTEEPKTDSVTNTELTKPVETASAATLEKAAPEIKPAEAVPAYLNTISNYLLIDPAYISHLSAEYNHLRQNSFILHGYDSYRHLILAKWLVNMPTSAAGLSENSDVTDFDVFYQLGVPGIYSDREKAVAEKFGFLEFKTTKTTPLRYGDFGYWLVPVTF